MGGKAKGGRRASQAEAAKVANDFLDEMHAAGVIVRGLVAGSIRRGLPEVGDIDLVVIGTETFDPWMKVRFGEAKNGKPKRSGLIDGIQVDVLTATNEGWGAASMHFTGSKETNIAMRLKALELGWKLNEKGLWKGEELMLPHSLSEKGVYAALRTVWQEPEDR